MIISPAVKSYGIIFALDFIVIHYLGYKYLNCGSEESLLDVNHWIEENDLDAYRHVFESKGFDNLLDYATIDYMPELTVADEDKIRRAANSLKQRLIFAQWLQSISIFQHFSRLLKEDVSSLEDVYLLEDSKAHELLDKDFAIWSRSRQMLPSTKEALETFKDDLWLKIIETKQSINSVKQFYFNVSLLLSSVCCAAITTFCWKNLSWLSSDSSILYVLNRRYLAPDECITTFQWSDPHPVGDMFTFTIKFFQKNGLPYPICDKDQIEVKIVHGMRKIACVLTLGGTNPEEANLGTVKFTVRQAGEYDISIFIKRVHIRDSPFRKRFLPGPVDPAKTKLEKQSSVVVCREKENLSLTIQPRDIFQNLCLIVNSESDSAISTADLNQFFCVVNQQDGAEKPDVCFQVFEWDKTSSKVSFEMFFIEEGCYRVQVFYRDTLLQNGDFTCVVLNGIDYETITQCVKNRRTSYDVRLTRIEGEPPFKPKKVTLFMSSKQLTIKEYIWRFSFKRIATFRLRPPTKLQLVNETANGVPSMCIEDGTQPTIYFSAFNRNVIAATFTKFLLNNIGGSETFSKKQQFFYNEVRQFHKKYENISKPIIITVNRYDLLNSSIAATKNFTTREWCSEFKIIFMDELGIDYGGVKREWFHLTCVALFGSNTGLFAAFSDNPQALVHPNKNRATHLNLKHYEFAGKILGKSLYDAAKGRSCQQSVFARFTRSFLAQLIGLPINYNYFQSDDPDLYRNKVKYILDQDVSDMDLYFVDEEYYDSGQLKKVVNLIPNGSKIKVTNQTKRQYLVALAQYRLANSVKDALDAVSKGLYDIVPDSLLCIFDENELELLLCGTGEYSISDFQAHHIVGDRYSPHFARVLKWFWITVSNFTTEEMARLLQFTTGSSQLPPGGFKDLKPPFQIIQAYTFGNLPTARTCFNELCLPDYESYEQFEQSLMLAINEGAEGFGLC